MSIARATGTGKAMSLKWSPQGTFEASNMPLSLLIADAYRVRSNQLLGGPGWMQSVRFDVEASAAGPLTGDQRAAMLRALYEERFHLKVRHESKPLPIYWLVRVRPEAPFGPGLKRSTAPCPGDGLSSSTGPGDVLVCGVRWSRGRLVARGVPMAVVAGELATALHTFVVDRTALRDNVDVTLDWPADVSRTGSSATPPSVEASTLSAALERQLGLKLISEKSPAATVVVERVEVPAVR